MVHVGADLRVRPQGIQHFDEDGRTRRSAPTHRYSSRFDTTGYTFRYCTIRRAQVTKEATACGRTNHSPQSKEQSSERLGGIGAYKEKRPPLAGGRTRAVDSFSPTHKGSINQVASSVRGSFGALPLRPTAMIRRTSARSFCVRHSIMLLVLQRLMNGIIAVR